jgi:hypothetical protein
LTDLEEKPAVPALPIGGDERLGRYLAGGILAVGGWGVLLGLNLLAHRLAPSSGLSLDVVVVYPTLGPFAIAAAALGAVVGVIGVVLCVQARSEPEGPFVLPGQPY